MMRITMLGTGNALVTECYNTCFILSDESGNFMTDTGGGSTILRQIKHAGFRLEDIHELFITHAHIDHILGAIWVIRIAAQRMNKGLMNGDLNIYSHDEVIALLDELTRKLLLPYQYGFVGKRIHMNVIRDGETRNIIGHEVRFFDIHSERTKQFGYIIGLEENRRLTFCGDEPCHPQSEHHVQDSDWLIHEAFCRYADAERFAPYEKHHSTVRDACMLAERLGVRNLLLCHTEDSNLSRRRELYVNEGRRYFSGKLYVPDDLESITL